jgi:uncharacterized protein DUF1932/6-phosphogluconate dehydrogenase-like protein
MRVIGLLNPGEMGAAVGACLTDAGHRVLWASQGRTHQTAARARGAALTDAGTAIELARRADIIVSVCPPHAALDVARSVSGYGGVYVDANAIAPGTAREVAEIVQRGGATYVDGGIIGPPPVSDGTTRLYLSGSAALEVRDLFAGTALDARIITADVKADVAASRVGQPASACAGVKADVAASALKIAYAAWTKGSAALLLTARALAEAEGVAEALRVEWEMSQPGLLARCRSAERSATAKGWRWTAEMEEIAATMAAAGLPPGFHLAAAEVFGDYPRDSSAAD